MTGVRSRSQAVERWTVDRGSRRRRSGRLAGVGDRGEPHLDWSVVRDYLFNRRIIDGIWVTIEISVLATLLGLVLGIVLAMMKLSKNPVLKWIAEGLHLVLPGTPVLVQLIFWFNLAFLLPS